RGLKVDKYMTLATTLKVKAVKHEVKPPDEKFLPDWVQKRGQSRNLDITRTTAVAIVGRVGTSLNALDNALQILDIAKTGANTRKVTSGDLQYLPQSAEVKVWDILNELWAGRADNAIRILRRLELQNESPEQVLGGLAFGVRQVILAQGRQLNYWEAQRVGDALKHYNSMHFRRMLILLGEADLRIKTTNEPGFDVLEELVLKIPALRSEAP
ncbi:MAG: DNA polymerase III subunit delta, partial [bacterium]